MKKLIVACAVALSSVAVQASNLCNTVTMAAENTMLARQQGMSMSRLLELAEGEPIAVDMIMDAFTQPRFSDAQLRARAVELFRNKWENKCYKSFK